VETEVAIRKESNPILIITVLLTTAVVGGGYWVARQAQMQAGLNNITGWQQLPKNPEEKNASGNSNPIIKCFDAERGEFFTNAANCDEADLANRMSYAEPYQKEKPENTYGGKDYMPPEQQAVNSRSDRKQESD
jgi:hypothetical protein